MAVECGVNKGANAQAGDLSSDGRQTSQEPSMAAGSREGMVSTLLRHNVVANNTWPGGDDPAGAEPRRTQLWTPVGYMMHG